MDNGLLVQFRRAGREDMTSMWRVRTRAIQDIPRCHYGERDIARWASAPMPDGFGEVVAKMDVIVAERDGQVVGWGFLDKSAARLEAIFVDPGSQRGGIASRAVAILEGLAREAGIRRLSLSSTLNAVPFYERMGFERRTAAKYRHAAGFDLDCVLIEKDLDRREDTDRKGEESQA